MIETLLAFPCYWNSLNSCVVRKLDVPAHNGIYFTSVQKESLGCADPTRSLSLPRAICAIYVRAHVDCEMSEAMANTGACLKFPGKRFRLEMELILSPHSTLNSFHLKRVSAFYTIIQNKYKIKYEAICASHTKSCADHRFRRIYAARMDT